MLNRVEYVIKEGKESYMVYRQQLVNNIWYREPIEEFTGLEGATKFKHKMQGKADANRKDRTKY